MITLDEQLEHQLEDMAEEQGVSVTQLIKKFVLEYQSEKLDIQQADLALSELDEISLEDLKVKYDL